MKKITLICAVLATLLAVSCGKDVKLAAPMTSSEIQEKMSTVAVNVLNEVDPDNWKEFGQTGLNLIYELQNTQEGNIDDLSKDISELFVTKGTDPETQLKTTLILIKLSLLTGDVTIEDGAFKYTESKNPLNFTMVYDGKTYKAQMEASGESSQAITLYESETETRLNTLQAYIPAKAAVHVTENGKLFMDLSINPVVVDNNKNGQLDMEDLIQGSVLFQIPGYSFSISDLSLSAAELKGKMELRHNSTSVLYLDGRLEYGMVFNDDVKSVITEILQHLALAEVEVNTLSIMGGQAVIKGEADVDDIKKVGTTICATESEAQLKATALNNAIKATLQFDNNPTVQASFVAMVVDRGEGYNKPYSIQPGLRFADGSDDILVEEFFDMSTDNVAWDAIKSKVLTFKEKLSKYFGELIQRLSKKEEVLK